MARQRQKRLSDGERAAARAIELRMVDLGHTINSVAEGTGLHRQTVADFIRGRRRPTAETRTTIEDFLGWEKGHTIELAEKYAAGPGSLYGLIQGDEMAEEILASNMSDDKKRALLGRLWDKRPLA